MVLLRRAHERGHFQNDWLNSYHTFSFGEYYDPKYQGVSLLRVINDDRVIPGAGFPTHPHRDMEIITYVLDGALAHKDSMGNGSAIHAGDVQRMSAGSGITHSEFNPSSTDPGHFLQIWLLPNQRGIAPSYAQQHFGIAEKQDQLRLIVSPDGRAGSITANSDVNVFASVLTTQQTLTHSLPPERMAYVHIAKGSATLNDQAMGPGDGAIISSETSITLTGREHDDHQPAELLLFDLPQ